ncbi:unnamed protein product [Leuciscus chuanchicus]
MHSDQQEEQKPVKIEFIEDYSENRSHTDQEPLRVKLEETEEQIDLTVDIKESEELDEAEEEHRVKTEETSLSCSQTRKLPESFIPENIGDESPDVKRTWLHQATAKVIDQFVMLSDIPEAASGVNKASATPILKQQFPCRMEGCRQVYTYFKARKTHENKKHNLELPSDSMPKTNTPTHRDHIKEHTMARLGFGFLLLNVLDAIKEGDGGRLMRLYKVALLFYKAYGHTHYAYSTFLLTLQVNATLSPRMAHSVTWNRFWNGRGGKGRNIPLDLHLEHLNNFLKSFLKGLGPNLNEQSAARISQSIGVMRELMENTDVELKVTKRKGTHQEHEPSVDVVALVAIFRQAELFKEQTGREFSAFPGFTKNLLEKLDYSELWRWMREKIKDWRTVPI